MGVSYLAVGWNRQKKIYDWLLFGLCMAYLTVFVVLAVVINPDYTFETVLVRSTSTLALLLLHITLSIGPLARCNTKFLPFLYNRRHLGVTTFCIALVHGAFSMLQFHAMGNVNPFVSLFTSNTNFFSITGFPFQSLGFFALVILFLMAITSHDFWLHNLSPEIWKTLHMFVYLAYFLIIMHVMLGAIQYETHPVFVVLVGIGAVWLIVLHLIAGIREFKKDKLTYKLKQEAYYLVCKTAELEEARAKIFCINSERIAVYRYNNKLYAIHNVCKHQGGPLGEGKILDGCITCPWHGYQYLPQNGQSPPPFKEKVSTYSVKEIAGEVWLNPSPYPEGTEQKGADIS
jgi:methionine sulfoxide reductase heme-binding subunit